MRTLHLVLALSVVATACRSHDQLTGRAAATAAPGASLGVWLADGEYLDATDVLAIFGGLDQTTEAGRAAVAPLQGPSGGSYALSERRSLLGTENLLPTADGGDVACQGSINAFEILWLEGHRHAGALALAQQWIASVPIDRDGRVWDSANQQYHQKKQGAWESAAEWVLMSRLYAAHSGDLGVFSQSLDRLLCVEDAQTGTVRGSGATLTNLCALSPPTIAANSTALGLGGTYSAQTTAAPFVTRDKPRLQIAAAKRLVQRFVTGASAVSALLLPLGMLGEGSRAYPAAVCVRDVQTGRVVHNATYNMTTRNVTQHGWTRIQLQDPLLPNSTYDVAVTNVEAPTGTHPESAATWLTRTAVKGGGGRIETWGYLHAGMSAPDDDNSCCAQDWAPPRAVEGDALAPTMAMRLERGMQWQLGLASVAPGAEGSPAPPFGVLIVPDAFHNGVPVTGMATCSASSMWDQVRMGWKSMYINALFLASIDAWAELEAVGAVRSLQSLVGVSTEAVRAQVAADIDAQFGYDTDGGTGRGYLSWISCNQTSPDGALSRCPRGTRIGGGQRAIDTQMMPDMAWAVRLGIGGGKARARLDAMLAAGRSGGLVMNNLVPQEAIDPRIVSSADKWDPVDANHFCDPTTNGTMAYAGHCVCATDGSSRLPKGEGAQCYGNFGMNQQNGGRVFSTQTMVFRSGPYAGSLDDFQTNVQNLRQIAQQLRSGDPAATPLLASHRGYVRKRIPGGTALRKMCLIEQHGLLKPGDVNGSTLNKDAWKEDICSYNKDITFGLRTGPRGVLIGFAIGHLGLHVGANGTLLLYGQPVPPNATETNVNLPTTAAKRWPAELKGVQVGGVRVGATRVDIACNATNSATDSGGVELRCFLAWEGRQQARSALASGSAARPRPE